MAMRPIRLLGDPVLRTKAEVVTTFDKELRTLVKDLTDTMLEAPGVGLAAPQIGVGLRVFTYDVDDALGHLINPVLHFPDDEEQDGDEGCLSLPGLHFDCVRSSTSSRTARTSYGDPSRSRARPARPLRAARDRPPRRRAVHRPAGPRDQAGCDGGDPPGCVGGPAGAGRQGQPAPALRRARYP